TCLLAGALFLASQRIRSLSLIAVPVRCSLSRNPFSGALRIPKQRVCKRFERGDCRCLLKVGQERHKVGDPLAVKQDPVGGLASTPTRWWTRPLTAYSPRGTPPRLGVKPGAAEQEGGCIEERVTRLASMLHPLGR